MAVSDALEILEFCTRRVRDKMMMSRLSPKSGIELDTRSARAPHIKPLVPRKGSSMTYGKRTAAKGRSDADGPFTTAMRFSFACSCSARGR